MAERATILIPDISGFTDFTSTTALDHSAHIISELLELIVASNETGFILAEIEGDAALFYRTGEPLGRQELIDQCLTMFRNFHTRLKVIEQDTICQCGACQMASNLTLKFIAHYGDIKEIRVAQFVKATGIDMIVAHRLLKNKIPSNEYILITEQCCDAVGHTAETDTFSWLHDSESYNAIGEIKFEFTTLSEYKQQIPGPPERKAYAVVRGPDNIAIDIEVPLKDLYQMIINVDERKNWMLGVDKINREMLSERIGMQHNCTFLGMLEVCTSLYHEYADDEALYVERVEAPETGVDVITNYEFSALGNDNTRLNLNVDWKETVLPDEMKQGMVQGVIANLESLKRYCEQGLAAGQ